MSLGLGLRLLGSADPKDTSSRPPLTDSLSRTVTIPGHSLTERSLLPTSAVCCLSISRQRVEFSFLPFKALCFDGLM